MTISTFDVVLIVLVAVVTPVAIVLTAPSFSSGMFRLKLVLHTLGMVLLIAPLAAGIALVVWGIASGRKELVYLAILPFIFAYMARDMVLRGYRSFLGLGPGPFQQFWHHTCNLWRSARQRPNSSGPTNASPRRPQAGPATTFSFPANLGHTSARVLGPLIKIALDHLTSEAVSVLPVALHLDIRLPAPGGQQSELESFRRDLTVRRRDGGRLDVSVDSSLACLRFAVSPQLPDGSYLVAVGLVSEKLPRGRFAGTISIRTDDAAAPCLTVPVTGNVE